MKENLPQGLFKTSSDSKSVFLYIHPRSTFCALLEYTISLVLGVHSSFVLHYL